MNAVQQDYDFESIHRAVCPKSEDLTVGQRVNRTYPTVQDMLGFLGLLNDVEFIESKTATTPVGPAYWQAMNNTLLESPEKKWANGSAYVSHRLTAKGRAYLCWLKIATHKPKLCLALMAPIDISRLRVWQAYVEECCKVPFSVAVRIHQMEMSI